MFKRRLKTWPLALLLLAGCDDMPRARSESDIEAIATDAATDATSAKFSELEDRINDLESKVNDLETELAGERAYSQSVAKTVDKNADAANKSTDKYNLFIEGYRAHTH
jgi:septal ring factor EnvC (AmiA/AmiB activator)